MNTIALLAASGIGGLLMQFLFALLFIAMVGGLVWAINSYIHPIPSPILLIVAIVMVILVILWMMGEIPSPFGR